MNDSHVGPVTWHALDLAERWLRLRKEPGKGNFFWMSFALIGTAWAMVGLAKEYKCPWTRLS